MRLTLETKRLKLRAFQGRDIQDFAAYRSDPEVAKYQDWEAPYSLEKAAQLVKEMQVVHPGTPGEWVGIAIELKKGGNLIGDCAFHILAEDAQQERIGMRREAHFVGAVV